MSGTSDRRSFFKQLLRGSAQTAEEVATAFRGDPAVLVATAERYGADRIVLARRGATTRLLSQPAALAAAAGDATGTSRVVEGNGWDAVALDPGATLTIPTAATGPIDLEIRLLTPATDPATSANRFRLHVGDATNDLTATRRDDADFTVVTTSVDLQPGAPLSIEAIDPITVQSVTGFVPDPGPPAGWSVATTTDDSIVWQRQP